MFRLLRLSIIIIAILLAIASCSRRATDTRLLHAEAIIEEHPDSSLLILNAIDSAALATPADHALYALLLSQARDKNLIDITDTTLVRKALDFYKDGDERHLMLSWYYLGKANYNSGNHSDAMTCFKNAEKMMSRLDDPKYLGMILREISIVYANNYASKEQVKYAEMAYEAFKNYSDSSYMWYAIGDLGRAHCTALDYPEALQLSTWAADIARREGDSTLLAQALEIIGISHIALNNPKQAISDFESLMQIQELDTLNLQRYLLAVANAGDKVKINALRDSLAKLNIPCTALPHEFIVLSGDYKEAYQSLLARANMHDAFVHTTLTQTVTRTAQEYAALELEKTESELARTRLQKTAIIICSLFFLIILILVLRLRIATAKKNELRYISDVKNLKDELSKKDDTLGKTISDLIGEKYDLIDRLCGQYYDPDNLTKSQSSIFKKIKEQIDTLRHQNLNQKELETYVNRYTGNLIARLRTECPALQPREINLLLLCIVGFSTRTISLLTDESDSVVYNRKSRLKAKIKKMNPHCLADLLRYI